MVLGVLPGPHARPSSTLSLPGLPHRKAPCDTMLLPNASSPSSNNSLLLKPRIGIMSIRAIDPGSFSVPFTFASSICRRLVRSVTGSSRAHGQSWCSHLIGRLQSYVFTTFLQPKNLMSATLHPLCSDRPQLHSLNGLNVLNKCFERMAVGLSLWLSLPLWPVWRTDNTPKHTRTRLSGCLLRIGVM